MTKAKDGIWVTKAKGGMGFRDFHYFNKALSAKQFWLLWQTLNNLIAGIMKAKYFPNCQAFEANLGNKPSFAWHSIHSSKELLFEGLVWRIGNGENVQIWGTNGCLSIVATKFSPFPTVCPWMLR